MNGNERLRALIKSYLDDQHDIQMMDGTLEGFDPPITLDMATNLLEDFANYVQYSGHDLQEPAPPVAQH